MRLLSALRAAIRWVAALTLLLATPATLQAQTTPGTSHWGDWAMAWDRPLLSSATTTQATGGDAGAGEDAEGQPDAPGEWIFVYDLWQLGISSLSGLGPISPIQGRREVQQHADEIKQWAPDDLELLVAASIAHQASDFKDRPFGTDTLERVWRELVNDNISVGIAQLRRNEVIYWAPQLRNLDLLTPEVAIRVMTAKLSQTERYILRNYPDVSDTDRMMLLALAQNAASFATVRNTVDYFFRVAHGSWPVMLIGQRAQEQDWREQLRLVYLHAEWLTQQGWPAPATLDMDFWAEVAFSEPK